MTEVKPHIFSVYSSPPDWFPLFNRPRRNDLLIFHHFESSFYDPVSVPSALKSSFSSDFLFPSPQLSR